MFIVRMKIRFVFGIFCRFVVIYGRFEKKVSRAKLNDIQCHLQVGITSFILIPCIELSISVLNVLPV